jgi:hypothetical protein
MALYILISVLGFVAAAPATENLLVNGDFHDGLAGWNDLWTRTPGGKLALDTGRRPAGPQSVRIEHTGQRDWSLARRDPLDVRPGQIYELSGWVRIEGQGDTTLCVTLREASGKVTDWIFAGQKSAATQGWRLLRSRFVVPAGTATIQPRLIGEGPATVWFDDARLVCAGSLDELRRKDLPATLRVQSGLLALDLHTADGTWTVTDRRSGRQWEQLPGGTLVVLDAKPAAGGEPTGSGLDLSLLDPAAMLRFSARLWLEADRPEVSLELAGEGPMPGPLAFPQPLRSDRQTLLILPMNEGISYPAADETIEPAYHYLYGGHGLCMAWYGQTDGRAGVMTIVETPDDAGVRMARRDGLLTLAPAWEPEKGRFGSARRLRWVFFQDGGYVAMCKRYRQHARETGLLRTLADKRAANSNVDLLVGAVNVWCWERDAVRMCRDLQAAGIQRILWSNRAEPETLRQLNALGILTSRYDIYQDVMDPARFPKLPWVHPDWTTPGWPKDLMLDARGQWVRGWEVQAKDGTWYPCGVLCDRQAPDYARQRISAELKTHPYRCRFIDTTTASPWRECYDPRHPLTRSESRQCKMELLRLVSEEFHLVTGSETGHEAAVPYVHYFEGMLSLGPYRVPDAGRDMQRIWHEVPGPVAKFQTGHFYRLPLWELVYHDCLVAQWYWGDYNNKLPALWDRRDLLNALYGTPPMFMFNRRLWEAERERFVKSYRATAPLARATGYREMLAHRWLTADHAVQETEFAGGIKVAVNFGAQPYTLADGHELPPLSCRTTGLAAER